MFRRSIKAKTQYFYQRHIQEKQFDREGPQQVIPGREIDPYAIKTRLGWGIIGPTNMNVSTNDVESSCLRILTQEIGKTRVEERFRVDTRPKEVMNRKNILKMFELDFSEKGGDKVALSKGDRKFMDIVKDGIANRDGQYEIPLPI